MNTILLNFVDLIGDALLDYLNSEALIENRDGQICIKMNYKTKKLLSFYLDSQVQNHTFFGKTTVLYHTCNVFNNWRNCMTEDFYKPKYVIDDDSIWIDQLAMERFFDGEFNKLKKKYPKCVFLQFDDIDTIDTQFFLKRLLRVEIIDENQYNILKDGNYIYKRKNNFPDFILDSIRVELVNNNLLI